MSSPTITLTATLEDLTGAVAGSTANPAKLRITLCGYGQQIPQVPTANITIAKCGPLDIYSTGSEITTALWGNDVITPVGTYYTIEVLDGENNLVQSAAYQFTGTQTVDLSAAKPIVNPGNLQTGFVLADTGPSGGGAHYLFTVIGRTFEPINVGTAGTPIANPVFIDQNLFTKSQVGIFNGGLTITPVGRLVAAINTYPVLDVATGLLESMSLRNGTFGVTP
jgi:hypothetical protein